MVLRVRQGLLGDQRFLTTKAGSLGLTIKMYGGLNMITCNKELGNELFAQINWTVDDVLQIHEDWSQEDAKLFLQEIEDELIDIMAEHGYDLIQYHAAAEKYKPSEG
jgi:hypothetical protein